MILNRYILRLWWQPFIGALVIVTAVLLFGRMLKLLALFADKGIDWMIMGTMLLAVLPYFAVLTLPVAFFFAGQHMLIRLQQDNELDALQAAGISHWRLLRPLLVIAGLLWLLLTWTSLQWMPQGQKMFQVLMVSIQKMKGSPDFQPQRIDQSMRNFTVYVDGKDSNNHFHGLLLEDHRYQVPVIYIAQSAELVRSGTKMVFTLYHGTRLEGNNNNLRSISFAKYQVVMDAASMGLMQLPKWRNRAFEMGARELWHTMQTQSKRTDLIAEFHRRLILPTTILLLAIFILPLSLQPKRSSKATPYLLGVALILLLYNSQIILHQRVINGQNGVWIMWLGQGLFLVLALWLFHRASNKNMPAITLGVPVVFGRWQRRLTSLFTNHRNHSDHS
ncbi:MAG: LptF/LptG family permease [Mariprofundales bacterium]|nr:LptF/LptG family permease [Mariprofundales bacterium]